MEKDSIDFDKKSQETTGSDVANNLENAPGKVAEPGHEKNRNEDLQVNFSINIDKEEINRQIEQVALQYSSEIKLPGFRKGNVPLDIIKSRYKKLINQEALNKVIEQSVYDKIQKDKLHIISQPIIKNVDYKEGNNLKADITVEVFPEINFPDFDHIEVTIPSKDLKVEDYDEKKQIEAILEGNKRRIPINNREVRKDDLVMVKIQTKFLDTKRMTPKQKSSIIVNKEEAFEISNIYEEIIGKTVGDKVIISRNYPQDYSKKKWAGKELEHHIEIESVFELKRPALDKDFLKNMGFEDEQSFKKQLKVEFDTYWEKQMDEKKTMHIFDELTKRVDFKCPSTLVEQEFQGMKHQGEQVLKTMSKEQQKDYIESLKKNAEKSVKLSLIFEALQKKFNFEVTNDDLEKEYKSVAEKNKYPLAEVRRYYSNKDAKAKLQDTLLRLKILNFLKEKIKIKEV